MMDVWEYQIIVYVYVYKYIYSKKVVLQFKKDIVNILFIIYCIRMKKKNEFYEFYLS